MWSVCAVLRGAPIISARGPTPVVSSVVQCRSCEVGRLRWLHRAGKDGRDDLSGCLHAERGEEVGESMGGEEVGKSTRGEEVGEDMGGEEVGESTGKWKEMKLSSSILYTSINVQE